MGVNEHKIGDRMEDGTTYVGISPETGEELSRLLDRKEGIERFGGSPDGTPLSWLELRIAEEAFNFAVAKTDAPTGFRTGDFTIIRKPPKPRP